jgi:enolase-phosphatase E1
VTAAPGGIRVILLDIEGTTTPMAFVHTTLFTYARANLDLFLARHFDSPEVQEAIRLLQREHAADADAIGVPAWRDDTATSQRTSLAAYARWLMERDRKSPGLKLLQGLIWEEGYEAGALHGEVFDDVPRAIARWRDAGLRVAIYSSGSELAQRRLFQSTAAGDLTPLLSGFFDTGVGAKVQADSYRHIASALRCATSEILFVSDVTAELAAAREAGCATRLCARPGNPPQRDAGSFEQISSFDAMY